MNKHTATPWTYLLNTDNEERLSTHIAIKWDNWHIARIWNDGPNPVEDAAYIVKAVNSHEELVEALQDLLTTSATMYDHTKEHCKSSVKLDYLTYKVKAERALKLAGEEA